ncbi:Tyrosine-protein phosphatase non-receptor type 14-like [Homarus americanus]|uniref:protein-tyrosine-phosphatase n=1 Tax=Homarus americanus TaxID=6706 RepID=A0A8J5N5N3_HOMAM|nr:Tyrosine-protein phosphatase non-receptor type 14-like [Homarus americanus]
MKVKMPFKLRLKKTRHYNVLSRNVLVISVELLDKTTLECTLSADSTGQDCLHNVFQRLSLHQPEFFGLRYMSKKPYPKVRWVELDRPLKKQLDKYAQSPALALAVLYYIHDVSLLQDDVTRSHYFLQVKQDVLEGKLRCNHEQAVSISWPSIKIGNTVPEFLLYTEAYVPDLHDTTQLSNYPSLTSLTAMLPQVTPATGFTPMFVFPDTHVQCLSTLLIIYSSDSLCIRLTVLLPPKKLMFDSLFLRQTAEFGDHQPDRHTAEYLKDFMLFPKQVGSDGEVAALLEAVVWQYSSLQGLAQALAETYYILEAQRLDGYGQETFMARDERGSEVYLGTSLMGIDVRPAAGHTHIFYRWNDITNLVNNKRNFGIECQRTDETVHFTFDEPDAAKYVWKMCVKQHTFYKRNQEVLEGNSGTDTRSLAIPDLQSSVMTAQLQHLSASHDMVDSRGGLGELTMRSSADQGALASYTTTLPQFDMSQPHLKKPEIVSCELLYNITKPENIVTSAESSGHLGATVESSSSQLMSDPSYALLSQSAYSLNTTHHPQQNQVVLTSHNQVSQPSALQQQQQSQQQQQQRDGGGQQVTLYSSNLSLPTTRTSFRRSLLPQYRPAPDYETALVQKYGPGVNPANLRATMLYSSQPEISNSHVMEGTAHELSQPAGGVGSYSHYKGYTDLSLHPDPSVPQLSRSAGILMPGPLHNTYSTPELASPSAGELLDGGSRCSDGGREAGRDHEHELLHVYKPPPPYPYNKPSSNSTPDLATINQGGNLSPDLASRRRALLTASLGCLGSPDLSRTYENLADLSEAVESLRNELTRTTETGNTFFQSLHSFNHNYSCNDLDAIYQLSDGRVAMGTNLNLNPMFAGDQSSQQSQQKKQGTAPQYSAPPRYSSQFAAQYTDPQYPSGAVQSSQEPIYQNIAALRTDEPRERTRSAPEIENNPMNVVGPTQGSHLLGQMGGEEVQGGRSRALSQPVRQSAIDPQIYIENRLGEQQRGPIEAINTAMGGESSGLKLSPRKKWGAPSAGPMMLAGQSEPILASNVSTLDSHTTHDTGQTRTREATADAMAVHDTGQTKMRDTPADSPSAHDIGQTRVKETAVDSHTARDIGQTSTRDAVGTSELMRTIDKPHQGAGATKGVTPDVLRGATLSKGGPKDPRSVQLETKLVSGDILQEFELIPRIKSNADFTTATKPDNIPRNRYKDIVPYEENRASVGESQRFYICCQGPLANTVSHFWQCVWEADVYLVVMLTSVTGDTATSKSFPYWPQTDNTSVECGQVGFLEELSTLRRYTYQEVRGVGRNRNTPVLVHCSAGVGRSGVTILCDLLLEATDHNLPLDPPKVLLHLRQQRMALVQTIAQYKFVYQVLLAYLNRARLI